MLWKHSTACRCIQALLFGRACQDRHTGALVINRRRMKADPWWRPGIYLGRAQRTNEHMLGGGGGMFLSRSVRRRPPSEAADKDLLLVMKGTPWEFRQESKPGRRPRSFGAPVIMVSQADDGVHEPGGCRS